MIARQPSPTSRGTARRIRSTRAGFTIIEMVAASAIMLVLALILIPILRGRVEESKVSAAQADLRALEESQVIAHGFTSHYYRPNDLIRPKINTEGLTDQTAIDNERKKLPQAYWNEPFPPTTDPEGKKRRDQLEGSWTGPYLAPNRAATLKDLLTTHGKMFRTDDNTIKSAYPDINNGPLLVLAADNESDVNSPYRLDKIMYPVDPWGNPYLFFGNGKIGNNPTTAISDAKQEDFATAMVYSLGPDGLPGNKKNPDIVDFFRDKNPSTNNPSPLGQGDDLKREF